MANDPAETLKRWRAEARRVPGLEAEVEDLRRQLAAAQRLLADERELRGRREAELRRCMRARADVLVGVSGTKTELLLAFGIRVPKYSGFLQQEKDAGRIDFPPPPKDPPRGYVYHVQIRDDDKRAEVRARLAEIRAEAEARKAARKGRKKSTSGGAK